MREGSLAVDLFRLQTTFITPLIIIIIMKSYRDRDQDRGSWNQVLMLVFDSRTRRTAQGNAGWTTERWVAGS